MQDLVDSIWKVSFEHFSTHGCCGWKGKHIDKGALATCTPFLVPAICTLAQPTCWRAEKLKPWQILRTCLDYWIFNVCKFASTRLDHQGRNLNLTLAKLASGHYQTLPSQSDNFPIPWNSSFFPWFLLCLGGKFWIFYRKALGVEPIWKMH